jgi:hypothetical protein
MRKFTKFTHFHALANAQVLWGIHPMVLMIEMDKLGS